MTKLTKSSIFQNTLFSRPLVSFYTIDHLNYTISHVIMVSIWYMCVSFNSMIIKTVLNIMIEYYVTLEIHWPWDWMTWGGIQLDMPLCAEVWICTKWPCPGNKPYFLLLWKWALTVLLISQSRCENQIR